jgi:hypothetical protein
MEEVSDGRLGAGTLSRLCGRVPGCVSTGAPCGSGIDRRTVTSDVSVGFLITRAIAITIVTAAASKGRARLLELARGGTNDVAAGTPFGVHL